MCVCLCVCAGSRRIFNMARSLERDYIHWLPWGICGFLWRLWIFVTFHSYTWVLFTMVLQNSISFLVYYLWLDDPETQSSFYFLKNANYRFPILFYKDMPNVCEDRPLPWVTLCLAYSFLLLKGLCHKINRLIDRPILSALNAMVGANHKSHSQLNSFQRSSHLQPMCKTSYTQSATVSQ